MSINLNPDQFFQINYSNDRLTYSIVAKSEVPTQQNKALASLSQISQAISNNSSLKEEIKAETIKEVGVSTEFGL